MEREIPMWTCNNCSKVNEDLYGTVCGHCGAKRSTGRFGSNPETQPRNSAFYNAPRVQNAQGAQHEAAADNAPFMPMPPPAPQGAPRQNPPPAPQHIPAPQAQYMPSFAHVRAGRCTCLLGFALLTLLPLLTLLLAWRQYDALAPALLGLIFRDLTAVSALAQALIYVLLALIAALIALLPGAWTLAAGKALHRLARMEEQL